jgi:hypothetical protein
MDPIIIPIVVDISKKQKYKTRTLDRVLVKDDSDLIIFKVTIQKDGAVLDLSGATSITLTFLKDDGNVVVGNAVITDAANGLVSYTLGTNEVAYPGNVIFTAEVYEDSSRTTSSQVKFKVIDDLGSDDALQSTTQYTMLAQILEEATTDHETYQQTLIEINAAKAYAENAAAYAIEKGDEAFQEVSNGKTLIASAIVDKDGTADGSMTFQQLSDAIRNIVGIVGKKFETGMFVSTPSTAGTIRAFGQSLPFRPGIIILFTRNSPSLCQEIVVLFPGYSPEYSTAGMATSGYFYYKNNSSSGEGRIVGNSLPGTGGSGNWADAADLYEIYWGATNGMFISYRGGFVANYNWIAIEG